MHARRRTALSGLLLVGVLALLFGLTMSGPALSATTLVGALGQDGLPLADDLDAPATVAPRPDTAGSGLRSLSATTIPIVFPMEKRWAWTDTWGAPRSGGRTHEGNDILVPKMTKALAVVSGTLDWMNFDGKLSTYNNKPYYNILLRGDDGNDYFYIHLNNDRPGTDDGAGGVAYAYAPGLKNGSHVEAGQFIAYIGDSGNAEDTASHLHFEIHPGGYKNPVNPYASLVAARVVGGGTAPTAPPVPAAPPVPSFPFKDVLQADWFSADLLLLADRDVVKSGTDIAFRPYDNVTRAHFAAFLVRAFRADELKGTPPPVSPFADIPLNFWGYREITTAAGLGLVNGVGDGSSFDPDSSITRAQMAAMLARTLDLITTSQEAGEVRTFSDVPQDFWAAREIAAVQSIGLIKGTADGGYHPYATAKRSQAAAVVARGLRLENDAG